MNIEPAQVALGKIRKKHFGEWKFSSTSWDILFTKTKKSNKETTLNLLNCLAKPVLQLFQIFSQEGLGIPRACVVTSLIDNWCKAF